MNLIDGLGLSKLLKKEISIKVESRISKSEKRPHLAAVLVGDNPASQVYVRNKVKSCEEVGFISTLIRKPSTISEMDLIQLIQELNSNEDIDGFIVQLPLPKHINEQKITLAIHPAKDVDGFHPENFGRMAQGMPCYLPATPMGIVEMIKHYKIQTQGKEVVVVGRSNIVGTPISILLSRKDPFGDATVTLCHSKTVNLSDFTKRADILIAAIGIPEFIKGDMVKDGVVVIDVGMNRLDGKLTGDVHFPSVAPKSSFITPVPGGVGPMTVVSLLLNTLKAAEGKIY